MVLWAVSMPTLAVKEVLVRFRRGVYPVARAPCYVAESRETARREAASYAATKAYNAYMSLFQRDNPEVADLRQRLERAEPGIIDELRRVYEVYDPYQTETLGAPHDQAVTQRVIDFFLLTGTPEDICEGIYKVGQLGAEDYLRSGFHRC
jgi:alkanesulfonate monooxygenase SsuD/methylene tetrahydromethanopterin reductase-like flavin-dependent oxidoreductase (luciferase family)